MIPPIVRTESTRTNIARRLAMMAACAVGITVLTGCPKPVAPEAPKDRYHTIPADPAMPVFLKGTIKDLTVSANTTPFPVTSYGLVTGLRGTGDSTAPGTVRDWMLKEMSRHKVGSAAFGYEGITPEQMLADPHVAIVTVVANIPPGARKGEQTDAIVQALPNNNTSSLANGMLWRTALRINGVGDPFGAINEFGKAQGNLFVNPAYAGATSGAQTVSRVSLRTGVIPNGAVVTTDRPIHLVMRNPSWAGSRQIEQRINYRFQTPDPFKDPTAAAQDEGYIHLYVPRTFNGNWQHFLGVATHLYLNTDSGFASLKAKQLVDECLKPDAPLMDISYCWEGIGAPAIPFLTPLLTSPRQDVQFAAARAAAFVGDRFGEDALVQIATTPNHAFQVNAVQTLGELPNSPLINASIAKLLDSEQSLVRIEAYRVLAAHEDGHIFSKVIRSRLNPENEFVLDLIVSNGPPLIYCSRLGQPRVAIFGRKVAMETPVTFSAFDSKLTIATLVDRPKTLNIFYREDGRRRTVEALSGPDVGELVARLGGSTDEGFHFNYGDIVAILQAMVDRQKVPAAFVLQQAPNVEQDVREAPSLPDTGRPQTAANGSSQIGASLPDLPLPILPKRDGEKTEEKKSDTTDKKESSGRPQ